MKIIAVILLLCTSNVYASEDVIKPREMNWAFDGIKGKFDYASIQRGFKVYKEVCAACHSVKQLSFRHLSAIGFSEDQIKSLASGYDVQDGPNDQGQMFKRPGRPSDKIPSPFANEQEARASNNGALPPDLSLMIKARENGANYVYSLLTGFTAIPEGVILGVNMYYNPYFAGGGKQLAMSPPLIADGQVQFDDGTEQTINQMAFDVVNFLQWAAEPEMQERKSLGVRVLLFVGILGVLMWFANKAVWANIKKK